MKSNLVDFEGVSKFYGEKKVIDNISFSIERNTIVTLVGPNGAGKTTIAKLILDSEKPTSGIIKRTKNISFGYVPQKINTNTNLPITVSALLELLTGNKWRDAGEILKFAQVQEIENDDLANISGGQISRVFLAACLINKANLIILDEPTKELDINGQSSFYSLLENIKSHFDVTIFIISHDLHTVIKTSDNVLCLNQHLCCYGKPQEQYKEILDHIGFYKHHHNHQHN